ncbi:MAG: FAD:protein FMN transferase [Oscillospiraceae bacterium]|nr:FAD:protein FMN transferase [Oscillospiraceae bacterium]
MKIKFLLLSGFLFLFCGCQWFQNVPNQPQPVTRTEYALGTIISVRVNHASGEIADSALDKAFSRLFEIERITSAKLPDSELFFINQNAFESTVIVSEELFFLLKSGLTYAELTGGAFDITLGSIVDLWGIGTNNARIPSQSEISKALENCGFEHLVLNEDEFSVRFLKEGLKLDLGAIAKGYAADEMKQVLAENGITSAVLDLGGNIITIGNNAGNGWIVGITDPLIPNEICAKLHVYDKTIVTSGNYERFFMYEDTRYHHIFDRRTGFPSDSGIISATVITDVSMTADALSTAFFVLGTEEAVKLTENLSGIEYILIDRNLNFSISEGIEVEIIK